MTPSAEQLDALKEMINIGVGRAGGILNDLLHARVTLKIPMLRILSPEEVAAGLETNQGEPVSSVQLRFKGPFSGRAKLIFPKESASKLVSIVMGQEDFGDDLDSIRSGVLMEMGNIVINSVMGSIANILSERLSYSTPCYSEGMSSDSPATSDASVKETILLAQTRFNIEKHHIEGDVALVFDFESFGVLLSAIDQILTTESQ
ncbi:MAG: chemotaxis protein CheC [Nitrospirota bacterium]|nr:chemotaxis protein CheC [Nitrospirota bacterium]